MIKSATLKTVMVTTLASFYSLCAGAVNSPPQLHIILDTSASMANKQAWVAKEILQIQSALSALRPQEAELQMTLLGFTDRADLLTEGNALAIAATIESMDLEGSVEDGLVALEALLRDVAVRRGDHVVLITDEDRDAVDGIGVANIKASLKAHGIVIHLVDARSTYCKIRSLPMLSPVQQQAPCAAELERRKEDNEYLELVTASGGQYWFISDVKRVENQFAEPLARKLYDEHFTQMDVDIVLSGDRYPGQTIYIDASQYAHKHIAHQVVTWSWDFDNDGYADDYGPYTSFIYHKAGHHQVQLTLADNQVPPAMEVKTIDIIINDSPLQ